MLLGASNVVLFTLFRLSADNLEIWRSGAGNLEIWSMEYMESGGRSVLFSPPTVSQSHSLTVSQLTAHRSFFL